jgi:hypothetical protein
MLPIIGVAELNPPDECVRICPTGCASKVFVPTPKAAVVASRCPPISVEAKSVSSFWLLPVNVGKVPPVPAAVQLLAIESEISISPAVNAVLARRPVSLTKRILHRTPVDVHLK